jgi:hypothetical protein
MLSVGWCDFRILLYNEVDIALFSNYIRLGNHFVFSCIEVMAVFSQSGHFNSCVYDHKIAFDFYQNCLLRWCETRFASYFVDSLMHANVD